MDREILFRGKRTDNGEWIKGFLFSTIDHTYIAYRNQYDDDLFFSPEAVFIEALPETVCQYTGLTDRNGRKIFEGDIIQFEKKKYSVVWLDGTASFAAKPFEDGRCRPCMNCGTMKVSEVVGNIFDSPELLEGEG